MAVELLETLKQAIIAYTGLSPTTFFTVVALGLAVYYAVSVIFGGSDDHQPQQRSSSSEAMRPLPPPVQLGEVTVEELKAYDGTDPKKPLLMAIKGQIYDVTQSRMFYGPGGPYALFAGKDASRALAKMSFEEKDLNGDLTGLGLFELDALQDWEYKFMTKYAKVGSIKTPETSPVASTAELPVESTAAQPTDPNANEPTDSTAAQPTESTVAQPSEPAANGPTESTAAQPTESTVAQPSEPAANGPTESTAAQPAGSTVAQPSEPTANGPTESTCAQPAEPATSADRSKVTEDDPSENVATVTKEESSITSEAMKEE